jgi:hypothetical protein
MIFLVLILAAIMLARVILPYAVRYLINRAIKKVEGLEGYVNQVRINLTGSNVRVLGVFLSVRDIIAGIDKVKISCVEIKVCFKWRAILRRQLDAKVILTNPTMVYTHLLSQSIMPVKSVMDNALSPGAMLRTYMEKIPIPFDIDLQLSNGAVVYVNDVGDSTQDVKIDDINFTFNHCSNKLSQSSIPAQGTLHARLCEGTFTSRFEVRPLQENLTLELDAALTGVNLTSLNGFFKQHANIDFNAGQFGIATSIVTHGGKFRGYIKSKLTNFKIVGNQDRGDSFFNKVRERLVSVAASFLKNTNGNEIVFAFPIQGRLDDPSLGAVSALRESITKAFVQSLWDTLKKSINFRSVLGYALSGTAGFLRKMFGGYGGERRSKQLP